MTAPDIADFACPVCGPQLPAFLASRAELGQLWAGLPRVALRKGQIAPAASLCFVEEGLLRSYWIDADGQECNRSFHLPGEWAGSVFAHEALVSAALNPSRVVVLSLESLTAWQGQGALAAALVQALRVHLDQLARREASMRLESASQRYERLLHEAPGWLTLVPQHQVASYLGITPVALSRIRRRLR
jgi:CRP-like cAMP-binding protein